MEEKRKRTYVSPKAIPVVFQVRDIVITSGAFEPGDDYDSVPAVLRKADHFIDGFGV